MTAVGGLVLALTCLAIVATGLALAVIAWQPTTKLPGLASAAGLTVGCGCILLAALHWLANLLT